MKVLVTQSRLTLCDTMDCSQPGSSVHGIFQARILEWVPFPSPGDLSNPGMEPGSCTLQADSLQSEKPPGKPKALLSKSHSFLHMRNMWRKLMLKPLRFLIHGSGVGLGFVFLLLLSVLFVCPRMQSPGWKYFLYDWSSAHLCVHVSSGSCFLSWYFSSSGLCHTKTTSAWRLTLSPDFHKPGSSCHSVLSSTVTSSEMAPLTTNSQVTTRWILSHSLFFRHSPCCF